MKCSICKQEGHNKRFCKKIEVETDVIPQVKVEVIWNQWSEKSKDIPFKSSVIGVGDGEQKISSELDTPVLGQNSSYGYDAHDKWC